MDAKKEVQLLENALKLCLRVQIQGFEAQPAAEAIELLKKVIDAKQAALPPEVVEDEEGEEQDGQNQLTA